MTNLGSQTMDVDVNSPNYNQVDNNSGLSMSSAINYSFNDDHNDSGVSMNVSSIDGVNKTGSSYYESEWHGLAQLLCIYASPIIFITGCTGNILILIIMGKPKFRGTSTCVYLRLMALADLLVLIIGMIPEWLSANEILIFKEVHPWTCKTEKFVQFSVGDTAIWILVAFTCDRFLAVCFPLNKTNICKPNRAKIYCGCLLVTSFVKNFHLFWTRGAEYYLDSDTGEEVLDSNCGKPEPYKHFEKYIRPWIAFTLISALPFLIILFCNIMIIKTLIQARKMHKGAKIQTNQEKTYFQMTMMCVSASFAFLIFLTPSIVLLIGKPYWKNDETDGYIIAKAVNNQLTYVNHSINFFLYCFSGKRFRIELLRLFGRGPPPGKSIYSSYAPDSNESRTTLYKANVSTPILGKIKMEMKDKKDKKANSSTLSDGETPIIGRSNRNSLEVPIISKSGRNSLLKDEKNDMNDRLLKRDTFETNGRNSEYILVKQEKESSI